jgi:hypothetical protein
MASSSSRSRKADEMDAAAVPEVLRERLGPDATGGLLDMLDLARREWSDNVIEVCAARFEHRLLDETSKLRLEIAQGDAALRLQVVELGASLRTEMAALGGGLRGEMAERGASLRSEMAELGASLRSEMAELGASLRGEMAALVSGLRGEMTAQGSSLRQEMAELRFDILKWCFLFWVGQVVAVAGVFALMLRMLRA